MKVKNVMTRDVVPCSADDSLSAAAMVMWNNDCGVVPIVDEDNRVAGILTDRDICMSVTMQGRSPSDVRVGDHMSRIVHSVHEEDNIQDALDLMAEHSIRRTPVVDSEGGLAGIVSISDIVRHSDKGRSKKHISHRDAMRVLKAVSTPRAVAGRVERLPGQPEMAVTASSTPEPQAAGGGTTA